MGGYEIDKSQMNRLIWGDNLLAMQALLAQGYAGKIDLIYIDPPFKSNSDYSFKLAIEGQNVDKEASIIERLAYIDTWEAGLDSYLDMIYPRLQLMKRLLSEKGTLYVHLDCNIVHHVKIMLDETFGINNFLNEIIWRRKGGSALKGMRALSNATDILLVYTKSIENYIFNTIYCPLDQDYIDEHFTRADENGRKFQATVMRSPNPRPNLMYNYKGYKTPPNGWAVSREKMEELDRQGLLYFPDDKSKQIYRKIYLDEYPGQPINNLWTDIATLKGSSKEILGYPTQKPEALLERILKVSSNEGDLVADFFCGSGTTMAVAEKLNRRWIGCNLDKVGIQVSRNRLVNQGAKPFLLENIGNYQRHMIYLSGSKINEMQRIILKLYGAAPRSDRPDLGSHTPDAQESELVYVGYPDRPVTAKKVIELAQEAEILDGTGYKTLVVLAWDYDYNFNAELENRKAALRTPLKVNIQPLTIPPEIYNYLKKAKNEAELDSLRDKITFHEKPYLKVSKPEVSNAGDGKVVISLKIDRYVLMNYPIPEAQQVELRRAIKDNFAALIDYWAIDWDYDGKTFRSTWQAIRGNGKQASTVVTMAASPKLPSGKRAIAVRLVDVFGNDASATVEVK
jgi:adenine-specific DNA-methyltransferase